MSFIGIEQVKKILKSTLSEKTYCHSLNTMETAMHLCYQYAGDSSVIEIASLLHDCAKQINSIPPEYLPLLQEFIEYPSVIHAPLGALIAQKQFGIEDERILNAIRYHTTGRGNMTLEEKIVFVADAIEPYRSYCGIEELRKIAEEDIDEAILTSLMGNVEYLSKQKKAIHPLTIEAINYLMKEK